MKKNSEKQVLTHVLLHLPLTLTSLSLYLTENQRREGRRKRERERVGFFIGIRYDKGQEG